MVELDEKPSEEEVRTLRQMVLDKYELNLAANAGELFTNKCLTHHLRSKLLTLIASNKLIDLSFVLTWNDKSKDQSWVVTHHFRERSLKNICLLIVGWSLNK